MAWDFQNYIKHHFQSTTKAFTKVLGKKIKNDQKSRLFFWRQAKNLSQKIYFGFLLVSYIIIQKKKSTPEQFFRDDLSSGC